MGLKKFRKVRAKEEPYVNVDVVAHNVSRFRVAPNMELMRADRKYSRENRFALPWLMRREPRDKKAGGEDGKCRMC